MPGRLRTARAVLGTLGNGLVGALHRRRTRRRTPRACTRCSRSSTRRGAAGGRDGGVVARARSGPRQRGALRRCPVHQSTRDHLDYHGTMAAYGAAKAKLFAWPSLATAVVNARRSVRPESRGVGPCPRAARAHLRSRQRRHHGDRDEGERGRHRAGGRDALGSRRGAQSGLIGTFNAVEPARCARRPAGQRASRSTTRSPRSRASRPRPGRMQCLGGGFEPLVVVDYAHSPDALEKVLTALRSAVVEARRAVCVFGCGGTAMRASARRWDASRRRCADRIVVTNDNPRTRIPR